MNIGGIARKGSLAPAPGGIDGVPKLSKRFLCAAELKQDKSADVNGVVLGSDLKGPTIGGECLVNQREGLRVCALFQIELSQVLERDRQTIFILDSGANVSGVV